MVVISGPKRRGGQWLGQIRTRLTGKSRSRSANHRAWGYKPTRPPPLPHAPLSPPYHSPEPGALCSTPPHRASWTAKSRCATLRAVTAYTPQPSTPSPSTPPSTQRPFIVSISRQMCPALRKAYAIPLRSRSGCRATSMSDHLQTPQPSTPSPPRHHCRCSSASPPTKVARGKSTRTDDATGWSLRTKGRQPSNHVAPYPSRWALLPSRFREFVKGVG